MNNHRRILAAVFVSPVILFPLVLVAMIGSAILASGSPYMWIASLDTFLPWATFISLVGMAIAWVANLVVGIFSYRYLWKRNKAQPGRLAIVGSVVAFLPFLLTALLNVGSSDMAEALFLGAGYAVCGGSVAAVFCRIAGVQRPETPQTTDAL